MQSRREFLRSLGGVSLASLAGSAAFGAGRSTPRPNVLFVLTDDQRHDAMGCAGNPLVRTPSIDALAAQLPLRSADAVVGELAPRTPCGRSAGSTSRRSTRTMRNVWLSRNCTTRTRRPTWRVRTTARTVRRRCERNCTAAATIDARERAGIPRAIPASVGILAALRRLRICLAAARFVRYDHKCEKGAVRWYDAATPAFMRSLIDAY